MVIFGLILTTFELNINFGGSWGSIENWLKQKTIEQFSLLKSVNHSVGCVHHK
jgi:hypothetical protein